MFGEIDFCISYKSDTLFSSINFLWAEAKRGKADLIEAFIQLIITIGREKTFANEQPPIFLGAFNAQKIAFIPYSEVMHIFSLNDFNWNITPSKHNTKEFKQLYNIAQKILETKNLEFDFEKDSTYLKSFINDNFTLNYKNLSKIQITKENFIHIYYKWLESVAPSINIDWDKESPDILSADFFLADVLSQDNSTRAIKQSLRILLGYDCYEVSLHRHSNLFQRFYFSDNQKAHKKFWDIYERPPKEAYWDYLIQRRDSLVPSNVRECKGAFFTPKIWVIKAQEYLSKALGSKYEDCYIWDSAAGTGNLLLGLSKDKSKIYASTLDKADVDIMQDLYGDKSLLSGHIFQFDFLNDTFFDTPCAKHKNKADSKCKECKISKLPKSLQDIIQNEQKRKKLIIFINPPYAEASSASTPAGRGKNKEGVATQTQIYKVYSHMIGTASRELYAQFFIRIYEEISNCVLASFSTLKYLNAQYYDKFRKVFKANFLKGFCVQSNTFDNVRGQFPIGFLVWDTSDKKEFKTIQLDIFENNGKCVGSKRFYAIAKNDYIINWLQNFHDKQGKQLGFLRMQGTDMQNNKGVFISSALSNNDFKKHLFTIITKNNLIPFSIYFAVRHCIKATWLNDRDQFLYPNDKWQDDIEFQKDCLAFMLFHKQNRITCKDGINHFIPFAESEINSKEAFLSDFMYQFINGKYANEPKVNNNLFNDNFENSISTKPSKFSKEAKNVFEAGKKLFSYYHKNAKNDKYNANASLYDIKAYFQGFNDKGKMNVTQKAQDSHYRDLIENLSYELGFLAKKIESKVYEYGFLQK